MSSYTHDHYRKILQAIKEAGFQFTDFPAISKGLKNGKYVVMRHDCDNDLVAALVISEIEIDFGIRSTYFLMLRSALYNLLSPYNLNIAKQILASGHQIGLHFDIYGCENLSDTDLCHRIHQELDMLENELGAPIRVVSFHQPSQRILENALPIRTLNTYSKADTGDAFYVSDSNMNFRYGDIEKWFSLTTHPSIQFLTHPEWWTSKELSLADKWRQMLLHNKNLMIQSLRTREKVYVE